MMGEIVLFPIDEPPAPVLRWKAVVTYRSEEGKKNVEHFLEELDDLAGLIEQGPDWNTIVACVVTLNRDSSPIPRLTIEQSMLI
ncbi:hypothetical protein NKJ09_22880 [Mesorhizobium sp. M0189]|uniref:hypothetical protein n=1 Tax=Mesorhizobium sp. M0189 TaxID=2956909 RepID=UPI00333D7C89